MSIEDKKISCSVCHAYLFPEDDVVYCPECGAPHHRDCYNSIGHCGLEEFHGTDNQYDKIREREAKKEEKAEPIKDNTPPSFKDSVTCQGCGNAYPAIMQRCPRCGTVNSQNARPMGGMPYPMFDLLGGVPKDMDLGEGVTAEEAKQFIVSNTPRYIPKFAAMKIGTKVSWNWLAFLLPNAWYMSRKMYAKGILCCALLIAFSLFSLPLLNSIYYVDTSAVANMYEAQNLMAEAVLNADASHLILAAIGGLLNLIIRVICGMFADYDYRNHTINTIAEIKKSSDNISEDFRKKGGISFWGLMLGFFAVQYLPTVIATFFNLL